MSVKPTIVLAAVQRLKTAQLSAAAQSASDCTLRVGDRVATRSGGRDGYGSGTIHSVVGDSAVIQWDRKDSEGRPVHSVPNSLLSLVKLKKDHR